jgi:hypothetical protein
MLKIRRYAVRDIYVFHRNGPYATGTGWESRKMISGNTLHIRRLFLLRFIGKRDSLGINVNVLLLIVCLQMRGRGSSIM